MAKKTVYGSKVYNTPKNMSWRVYVEYEGKNATIYGQVIKETASGHLWVRYGDPKIGSTTFSTHTETYQATGTSVKLGSITNLNTNAAVSFSAKCTGGEWGQNGTSSGTIPRQYYPPEVSGVASRDVGKDSAYVYVTSWNLHGLSTTDGGWDYTTDPNKASWSYSSGSPSGKTLTGLTHNTTYYYRTWVKTAGGSVNSSWNSFTTLGNDPVIDFVNPLADRTSCSFALNHLTYDTNSVFSSVNIEYGTTPSYGSAVSTTTITNLQPNTTYYYSMVITDNWGRSSAPATGSFTTTCNAPSSLNLGRVAATTDSMTIAVDAIGDTNAPITNYTVYYRKQGAGGNYTTINYGTGTSRVISGLDSDEDYVFYFTATNAGGTTTSGFYVLSPDLANPVISSFVISNLLPFSCTSTVTASVTPTRTLNYRFSKDNGTTWSSWSTAYTHDWQNLTEETNYTLVVQVKAVHTGNSSSDSISSATVSFRTPADQAKIRRMINGQWIKGKTYIKVNGSWVKAKKLYIKVNGQWKLNDNEH